MQSEQDSLASWSKGPAPAGSRASRRTGQSSQPIVPDSELGATPGRKELLANRTSDARLEELRGLLASVRAQIEALGDDVGTVGGWREAEEVAALRKMFGPAAEALRRIRQLDTLDRRLLKVVVRLVRE